MKKFCITCNKKQGFFSLNYKLGDGVICDDCVLPFGLSSTRLSFVETAKAINCFGNYTADEITKAIVSENDVFIRIRNEVFATMPPGVLFKFYGGLGELSEDVFVYDNKAIILAKGLAGTKLGEKEIIMPFRDVVSVSLEKALPGFKKNFIHFSQSDRSTISVAYSYLKENEAKDLKEFVENNINQA
ncbi:MAG: hypothetical protein FWC95_04335 [Defluviitaleaceae bacterium]|nr:hypothetical protein [Defluviitaleaceae bacterium]